MADNRAAHSKLIADAGVPADQREDVLDTLEHQIEVYATSVAMPDHSPEDLRGVIAAAENAGKTKLWAKKLEQRTAKLPAGLRFSIFPYLGYTGGQDGEQIAGELPTSTVLARATELYERIRRERGRPRSELAGLLFNLHLLFEQFFPDGGVAKNGTEAALRRDDEADGADKPGQDYLYDGALLNLVQGVLDVEGIEYKSRGAVGRELWEFVQQGRELEQRRAAGQCARCGVPLPNPENPDQYFCAECRTRATLGD